MPPFLLLLSALLLPGASAPPPAAPTCPLAPTAHRWMQRALDGWSVVRSDLLKLAPAPLPWMIFYDGRCAWHVAADRNALPKAERLRQALRFEGRPVTIAAVAHAGQLALPDGKKVPAQPMAFTSPHAGPSRTFFIVALPEHWRTLLPSEPRLEAYFLGASAHELAHTTQIGALMQRVAVLKRRPGIPKDLSDDVLEETFKSNAAYRALFERERDLFFEAAAEPDDVRARALAKEALALAQQRHRRFFSGERSGFGKLDALFLNMEGIGSWVQHQMARRDPANFADQGSIVRTKGRSTKWSQGEGLALMLLIDRFVPGWQKRMLAPELASPFDLLRTALDAKAA